MSRSKTSPEATSLQEIQTELNRLQRRRQAVNNLIRSVEEYLFVTDVTDGGVADSAKKPSLRVVFSRSLKEMMA